MKFRQILTLSLTVFLMTVLLTVPAFATTESSTAGFLDISSDSDSYEAVTYLADRGITAGTGNQCFSPETPITVRQWAVMLCRAYEQSDALADTSGAFGDACILRCYREGWLTETAVMAPDYQMCRSALLRSAFYAAGIPIYDYNLYPDGMELSEYDNILRIGQELDICGPDCTSLDLMTRGEAAKVLFQILTCEYEIEEPPMVSAVFLYNKEGVMLDPFLLELQQVPESILHTFERKGWAYVIDFAYLREFSEQCGMECIGATSYGAKRIYVSDHTATVHEFGHFLDQMLNFPAKHEALFQDEAQSSTAVLRDYATTNSREYFAEYFAYWITNRENVDKMTRLKAVTPGTYLYFSLLEANGWTAEKMAA